jgi:uroporphyrinogen decarboxylase
VEIANGADETYPVSPLSAFPAVDKPRGIPASPGTQGFTGPTTPTKTFFILSYWYARAMTLVDKPLLRVLRGDPVWPPPLWLMRQAGRYLPEYRATRARAGDFLSLCTNPALACEVTLQPIRRFRFDGAILFSDILILPWALGQGLAYKEGEGPALPPLRDAADIAALDPGRVATAVAPVMETVRRVRAGLSAEGFDATALIGFAGAPFTVACYMVEGHGSRDFAATRGLAYADPELFARLIDTLTASTIEYLAMQADAGAEVLMLFDTWAGILSSAQFRSHVTGPVGKIVRALRTRCPGVPVIAFPRLAGLMLGEFVRVVGPDAVGVDTSVDMELAAETVSASVVLQGNLDPLALVAGGEALEAETLAILSVMRGRRFVFNLGHGIVPQTPIEHVARLTELVRAG